ncbi:hypothetical protein AC578_4894 [Pseudocercospora eumusae]|uniref:Cytochrome P450 monooxygenase n=1 Tax=Pseudocercospora eumusae TaxID=321146 RepID=A0A139HNS6_9PEZI|nr:hypothetical protein AC578_4894 [Pseudocercospora eumusae]
MNNGIPRLLSSRALSTTRRKMPDSLTIAVFSTAIVLGILRFLSDEQQQSQLGWGWNAFLLLSAIYLVLSLYSTVIYPELVSPLRYVPRANRWLPRKLYNQLVLQKTPVEVLTQIARERPGNSLLALREPTGVTLLVTEPSVVTELLVSHASDFEKPTALQGFFKLLTLDGLLTVTGDQHKSLRKRSLGHFSFRSVKELYPLMWRHALHFAKAVETKLDGVVKDENGSLTGTVELSDLTNEITINVIGTTVFGRAYEASNDLAFKCLRELLDFFLQPRASTSVYLALTFFSPPWVSRYLAFPLHKAAARTSAALEKLSLQLVAEKKANLEKDGHGADLASHMIQSGNFKDYEIASQLLTYMIAGQETTAATIKWIAYLLAKDPDRQTLLRKEVSSALDDNTTEEDIADILEGFPYLNGVINETLRLYPTVPLTQREAVRDTTLGGHHIPAGTSIYLSPWLIQRKEEVWGPAAEQFCPERWIRVEDGQQKFDPSGGMKRNVDFLTFLHGPRNCIGQNFAKAELRCLTAALAMNFEWAIDKTDQDIAVSGVVTINPEGGLPLRVKTLRKSH